VLDVRCGGVPVAQRTRARPASHQRRPEPSRPFGCPNQSAQPRPSPAPGRARGLPPLAPQSQLFSRSYESILPTSLTYILYLDESFLSFGTSCGDWYGDRTNEDASCRLVGRPSDVHWVPVLFLNRRKRIQPRQGVSALPPLGLLLAMTACRSPRRRTRGARP